MNKVEKIPDRDTLAAEYFDLLPFEPYPVQEEALLAYFTGDQGVLVCAPTGTGKTLIAEAARILFDRDPVRAALQLGRLQELAKSALTELRSLIFELRPVEAPPVSGEQVHS